MYGLCSQKMVYVSALTNDIFSKYKSLDTEKDDKHLTKIYKI